MSPLVNFLCFIIFMVFKIHPIQDIASCMAWDKLYSNCKRWKLHIEIVEVMLNYEKKHLSPLRTVSTSKVSWSLMLKRGSSSRWGLSHRPRSSLDHSHSPGRLSSSEYDISYVHNSNIKLVQLNICTTKTKLDHYYSSQVDYRFVKSFIENSQLTWCIHSTVGDGRSSLCPRVHYTKMSS